MGTSLQEPRLATAQTEKSKVTRPQEPSADAVFVEWCLRREAPRWQPRLSQLVTLLPVLVAATYAAIVWPRYLRPGTGFNALRELLFIVAITVFLGGTQFVSRAVCWEVSPEMREIVRLTDLNARTLLWAKSLSRWWTIAWSLWFLLPLATFARTLGGVLPSQLVAAGYGLAMLWALTAGFALLASVVSSDAKNPEKSATNLVGFGMALYNLLFVIVAVSMYWLEWFEAHQVSTQRMSQCWSVASAAPVVSLFTALRSPVLFSPTSPGYWMHFITAAVCAGFATLAIEPCLSGQRLRDTPGPANDTDDRDASVALPTAVTSEVVATKQEIPQRPRCSDQPFFWKDVYILSDEGKWMNMWSIFYCFAAVAVLMLNLLPTNDRDRIGNIVVAVVSIVVGVCVISVRFDALLTAEFRDRTWGSLMLLPVNPTHFLEVKLHAAFWEQRYVLLPILTAVGTLVFLGHGNGLAITGMGAVISLLVGALLCQASCLNQLLGRQWWLGPCQAICFIVLLILCIAVWQISGSWLGFFPTAALLAAIVAILQYTCVNWLAQNWVEN